MLNYQAEDSQDTEASSNLQPQARVGVALYLVALNQGVVTDLGVLLAQGVNMPQIAKQAEVSLNYAVKALSNLRKLGFLKNRQDGRLLVRLSELEDWLRHEGCPLDQGLESDSDNLAQEIAKEED